METTIEQVRRCRSVEIAIEIRGERLRLDASPSDSTCWSTKRRYTQCHFFAGLGGWSRALRLAGWPDDRPVWTGSCPCQPFSVAGKGLGFDDPRHLWPHWYWLIKQRRPATIFGEQVAAATDWLGLVRNNLEALEYAVGAMPIEAASAGAEHFRDRYWFVADSIGAGVRGQEHRAPDAAASGVQGTHGQRERVRPDARTDGADVHCSLVNDSSIGWGEGWTEHEFRSRGFAAAVASIDGCQYIECPDGKWRRLPPPRVRWLGNGISARVAKLRALGNAIDPRPAAAFIETCIDLI
ncbi:DNA cytosine methyltransferase [Burkholderia gladioli]|uniref:DNA cytosine methyltransferase n=1 Tax=Burkholderia gladioli TaxID=28095 RepID=UPI003F799A6F